MYQYNNKNKPKNAYILIGISLLYKKLMFGDLILKCHRRLSIAVRVAICSKALEQLIKYSISFSSISPDG